MPQRSVEKNRAGIERIQKYTKTNELTNSRTALLVRHPKNLEVPPRSRRGARLLCPRASVGARELEDVQVSAQRRLEARIPPREVVLAAGPYQDV